MPSGLAALLDDVAVIARAAAASIDDVSVAATRAGTKAAGVVIDDAAVTPSYVTGLTPDRELPIIANIARGSIKNKLLILLPIALLLSAFLPGAITPLLMLGGAYLSFEGAEKVLEWISGKKHGETLDEPIADIAQFEQDRTAGAIRTDLILSAEIMAIALAEVSTSPVIQQAIILAIVGIAITVAVYGAVALIVKMDDIGLHMARRKSASAQRTGTMLLHAMPRVLTTLSIVGTIAMLWVGGGIILHGTEVLGVHGPAAFVHGIQHAVEDATGVLSGVLGWLSYAAASAVVGLALGAVLAVIIHVIHKARERGAH